MTLRRRLREFAKESLGRAGFELVRKRPEPAELFDDLQHIRDRWTLAEGRIADSTFPPFERRFLKYCLDRLAGSQAQLFQDLFVQFVLSDKVGGFFVEFGATDGIYLSNTYLLEDTFGWSGILAEPGKVWQPQLLKNRSCDVDSRCVWSRSGETLHFNEVDRSPGLSTIEKFSSADRHAGARTRGTIYEVESVSLNDLLAQHAAPAEIDYLSIDTEGSEFEILSALDFEKFTFSVLTVEHNDSTQRSSIHALLTSHGYSRVLERFSSSDDWFVRNEVRACFETST